MDYWLRKRVVEGLNQDELRDETGIRRAFLGEGSGTMLASHGWSDEL